MLVGLQSSIITAIDKNPGIPVLELIRLLGLQHGVREEDAKECLSRMIFEGALIMSPERTMTVAGSPIAKVIPKTVDIYASADQDSNWNLGEKLGLTGEALSLFSFSGCEVKLTMELDAETGSTTIVAVDGRAVEPKK